MKLCEYKDIFGRPKEGAHSFRLWNVAMVDLVLTVMFAYYFARRYDYKFVYVLGVTLLSGIITHRLFCVNTTINETIFGKI